MEFEGRRRIKIGLNLVPLINVIFLLLVFFMLAGTLRSPEPFDVRVPESTTSDKSEIEPVYEQAELVASADGRLSLNGQEIAWADLEPALEELFRGVVSPAVTFTIDGEANTGDMVDLIAKLRASGARLVFLTTRPLEPN